MPTQQNESTLAFYPFTPKPKSKLTMNASLVFYFDRPMPNVWWRLWQRAFFVFRWEKVC